MLLALYVFEGITSPLRTYWYFLSLLLLVTWSTWHRTRCQTLTAVYRILISKSLPGFIFKLLCTVTFACLNCTWRSTLERNHLKDNCSSFCFQNTAFLLLLYSLTVSSSFHILDPFSLNGSRFFDEFRVHSINFACIPLAIYLPHRFH